ncbi:hypothetical protein MXB_1507 [Myxobolus squamalis]|nr:hypothetical protein MXB_1507 [Myxobolus squamalis]
MASVIIWHLTFKTKIHKEWMLPGVGQSLASSPDGNYLLLGIKNFIYVWKTCNGSLIEILCTHNKVVSDLICLDNMYFISIGKDPAIYTWKLPLILSNCHGGYLRKHKCCINLVATVKQFSLRTDSLNAICKICVLEENSLICKIFDLFEGTCETSVFFTTIPYCCFLDIINQLLFVFFDNGAFSKIKIETNVKEINGDISSSANQKLSIVPQSPIKSEWDNSIIAIYQNSIIILSYPDLTYKTSIQIDATVTSIKLLYKTILGLPEDASNQLFLPKPLSVLSQEKSSNEHGDTLVFKPRYVHTNVKLPIFDAESPSIEPTANCVTDDGALVASYYKMVQDRLMHEMLYKE